jgi:DNA polymerase
MPRLFVVGDCFRGHSNKKDILWSPEEDELFWKMMAAIGLDQNSVFVTNCIKCSLGETRQVELESGSRCFPFLERELALLQPELICTLGELATSLILKNSTPLVRMRGHFHQYRYPQGGRARVMPTFHPRFLLRHPEMKRAAWMDLQAVQRSITT